MSRSGAEVDLAMFTEGKNIRRLESEHVAEYLLHLTERLAQLSEIFITEHDDFVEPYISIVRDTIECLVLKHRLVGEDKVDFSLTIDPTESGFPTVKDFHLLEKDRDRAEEILVRLPERAEIVEGIRDRILRKMPAVTEQIVLRRHNYYSKLLQTRVLDSFHLNEPKFERSNGDKRYYSLEWSCIEPGTNVPVFYRMYLTQDRGGPSLDRQSNERLESILYQTKFGIADVRDIARLVDRQIDELHPKLVEKYVIGPYYNSFTENRSEMSELFEGIPFPSVLKFAKESVVSSRVRRKGGPFKRFLGLVAEEEVYTPVDASDRRMIVPFRLKQKLERNVDEKGRYCRVYGITSEGDISG